MKKIQKGWGLGLLGFLGFLGIPGLVAGDWGQAVWIVWFVWFLHFIPREQKHTDGGGREKVLSLFYGKHEIANDDVQRALGVSDATATRVLDALEKSGDIEQVGDTGRFVVYRKQ